MKYPKNSRGTLLCVGKSLHCVAATIHDITVAERAVRNARRK